MHAITRNLVTCAAMGCHRPGTVPVVHTQPPRTIDTPDGRKKILEAAAVVIEYCPRHAPKET